MPPAFEVVGCALAGRAAELLEEGSDIASTTVAAMLHQLQVERLPFGGVLVVDEAGMLGDRQLAELVSLAARDEAKLVVVGDPFQLQPIEAGAPMRTLSDHIGRVELHENIRQVDRGSGRPCSCSATAKRARRTASTSATTASTSAPRRPSAGSR